MLLIGLKTLTIVGLAAAAVAWLALKFWQRRSAPPACRPIRKSMLERNWLLPEHVVGFSYDLILVNRSRMRDFGGGRYVFCRGSVGQISGLPAN